MLDTMSTAAPDDLFTVDVLTVYGADWCGDCRRTKRWLNAHEHDYRWVDRDADPEVRKRLADAGYLAIPVVVFPDGRILVEPSDGQMALATAATGATGAPEATAATEAIPAP
jgi:mycoredoxin